MSVALQGKTVYFPTSVGLGTYVLKDGEFLQSPGTYMRGIGCTDRELFFYFRFLHGVFEESSLHSRHFSYKCGGYMVYYNATNSMLEFFVATADFDEELAFFNEVIPKDSVLKPSDMMTELGRYKEFAVYDFHGSVLRTHSKKQLDGFLDWLYN